MPVALRTFTEPQQGATYDDLLAVAREAEALGFDAFFRSDHYLKMGDMSGLPGPTDAWITLAGLARDTERIRLGTLVTAATFRLPGPLAIAVAQVDAMSGGRVELGLGSGWYDAEHTAYGIPFPALGERFERLDEQLAIVTGLWTTPVGERFSFAGRHYQIADSPALPKPVQAPRPPLVVGGWGRARTPALAARYADEFNVPFPQLADFAPQVGVVRAACESAGRDPAEPFGEVRSFAGVAECAPFVHARQPRHPEPRARVLFELVRPLVQNDLGERDLVAVERHQAAAQSPRQWAELGHRGSGTAMTPSSLRRHRCVAETTDTSCASSDASCWSATSTC